MNFAEMETKATEQRDDRAEAFRKGLAEMREYTNRENAKMQKMLSEAGKRMDAETLATITKELNSAEENAEALAEDAQNYGAAEHDEQRPLFKKMLGKLLSAKE